MHDLDVAVTHAINGWAGRSAAVDPLMIWASTLGVPLLVLAVAGQWWRGELRAIVDPAWVGYTHRQP